VNPISQRAEHAQTANAAWLLAFTIVGVALGAAIIFWGRLGEVIGPQPVFLRTYAAIIGPCEVTAAILLVRRALRLRTRRATLLAAAYAISAPLVLMNLISLPGILGLTGFNHQTPPWSWTVWHLGWTACILGFAWLPDARVKNPALPIGIAFAGAIAFAIVAAQPNSILPPVLGTRDAVTPLLFMIGWLTIGTLVLSAFGLAVDRGATLDAWLLVAVMALALDEAFVLTTTIRFSIGTYLARTLGAINAAAMLIPITLERRDN
jgi:hypothetical protein